jgi:hypothetical protein
VESKGATPVSIGVQLDANAYQNTIILTLVVSERLCVVSLFQQEMPSVGGKASPEPFANEEEVDFQERLCYLTGPPSPRVDRGRTTASATKTWSIQHLSTSGSSHCRLIISSSPSTRDKPCAPCWAIGRRTRGRRLRTVPEMKGKLYPWIFCRVQLTGSLSCDTTVSSLSSPEGVGLSPLRPLFTRPWILDWRGVFFDDWEHTSMQLHRHFRRTLRDEMTVKDSADTRRDEERDIHAGCSTALLDSLFSLTRGLT